jgi:trehalose 6-phosphate phosphatase
MKDILAPENLAVLRRRVADGALLAFDYDGTLSPIVPDPAAARMRPTTVELLRDVTTSFPTILISGRAQGDALQRVRTLPFREVIGNHGMEPWRYGGPIMHEVETWRCALDAALRGIPGLVIEDKGLSLALHYRACADRGRAQAMIAAAIAGLDGARVLGGKQVVNLLPKAAPHKGQALEQAMQRLGCRTSVYVGDDETDEDVFRLPAERCLGIRVGMSPASVAAYYVATQPLVDELLAAVLHRGPVDAPPSSSRGANPSSIPWL